MMISRSTNRTPFLTPQEAEHLRHALEGAGCRFTRQRAAVYHYLNQVDTHPTAEEVYRAVQPLVPNISLATVYKSLEALVECKLATRLPSCDGPACYDCRTDNHYHLRDVATGAIRDVPVPHDPQLLQKLAPDLVETLRQMGFEATDYRLELLGRFKEAASEAM